MPSLGTFIKFPIFVALAGIAVVYYKPELFNRVKEFIQSLQDVSPASETPVDPEPSIGSRPRLFTATQLALYDSNVNENEIYLSIMGSVYDVSKGKKHYGEGCGYQFFTGKDASVSFVSGDFENFTPESDDVAQLKPADILSLFTWKKFYDDQYIYKGKLIGRFYNENGEPTKYLRKVEELARVGEYEKEQEKRQKELFPPCNIEWSAETGTRVWCTRDSGGIRRDWVGVPRQYFEPGQTSFRCACVKKDDPESPLLKRYADCDDDSHECFYTIEYN